MPMFSVNVVVRDRGDHVVVALSGELDLADSAGVVAALTAAAAGRGKTVVDLAGLAFIDCCGARALVRAQRLVRQAGGHLLLAAPRPQVRRVFVLSHLTDAVSFYASVERAASVREVPGMAAAPRHCVYLAARRPRARDVRASEVMSRRVSPTPPTESL